MKATVKKTTKNSNIKNITQKRFYDEVRPQKTTDRGGGGAGGGVNTTVGVEENIFKHNKNTSAVSVLK